MSQQSDILNQLLIQLAAEIKANIPVASGKTANSIEVRIIEGQDKLRGEIWGAKYIQALEDGRGPTKNSGGGSQTLQASIFEWLKLKGIQATVKQGKNGPLKQITQEQLSWAMAIKIHREGNELFRKGGKSGVLSNVLTDARLNTFSEVFNSKASRVILSNILKQVK